MEKEITIYDLKLHQRLEINDRGTAITRVPGGWIYEILNGSLNHIQQFLFHTAKSTELMNEPLATPAPSFRES